MRMVNLPLSVLRVPLLHPQRSSLFFFFNDTATTEIYTLSLHDALPISADFDRKAQGSASLVMLPSDNLKVRSEEHTSELQSQSNLVCRLLLEKKKKNCKRRVLQVWKPIQAR